MRRRALVVLAAALAVTYYAVLITDGSGDLLAFEIHGYTFNSMLEHLLRGPFDVEPAAIGEKGFLRDGPPKPCAFAAAPGTACGCGQ